MDLAVKKARLVRSPARYLVSAMLAGVYIGIGEVLMLSVAGPLEAGHSGAVKLVEGMVFPVALTLVMFAGADLFTSQCMTMTFGTLSRRTTWLDTARIWGMSLVGNLTGTVFFALIIGAAGTVKSGPSAALLGSLLAAKEVETGGQLFARAMLCNMLVCLAVWMFTRTTSDGAKAFMVWIPVFAFVSSGFEHSIANMSLFSLGIVNGQASVGDLAHNLAFTVPGNIVGGAVLVAGAYWFSNRGTSKSVKAVDVPEQPSLPAVDTVPEQPSLPAVDTVPEQPSLPAVDTVPDELPLPAADPAPRTLTAV
ncbi:hypothetical protein WN71_032825 [Streptomyces mangrovisoli]|uniref:Formate/nitrite transporter n=1 Tax=Streptomyces mangrovisoli TaxID=1428628 RepID=A0A1J4NMH0_9ACTN|nr:hypothetical protein WN71_032825 [Streptomyces mangrovisoli]